MTNPARPTCPVCHLPVEEKQAYIVHQGHMYHAHCAPTAEKAVQKQEPPYPPLIGI